MKTIKALILLVVSLLVKLLLSPLEIVVFVLKVVEGLVRTTKTTTKFFIESVEKELKEF